MLFLNSSVRGSKMSLQLVFDNYGKLHDGYLQSGLLVRQNMSHSGILTNEVLLLLPLTAPLS